MCTAAKQNKLPEQGVFVKGFQDNLITEKLNTHPHGDLI